MQNFWGGGWLISVWSLHLSLSSRWVLNSCSILSFTTNQGIDMNKKTHLKRRLYLIGFQENRPTSCHVTFQDLRTPSTWWVHKIRWPCRCPSTGSCKSCPGCTRDPLTSPTRHRHFHQRECRFKSIASRWLMRALISVICLRHDPRTACEPPGRYDVLMRLN